MSGADISSRSGISAHEYGAAWAAATAALEAGDLAAARTLATSIADRSHAPGLERRYGRAKHLLARIARAAGDPAAAEEALRAALRAFTFLEDASGAADVLTDLAEVRLAAGQFGDASDLSRQAVKRAPGNVRALTVLGYAQWLSGSPADGESTFEQALHIRRDAVAALCGRGQVRADLGDHRDALTDLDRALRLGVPAAEEADVRSARALALAGLGNLPDADAEITRAVELDPNRARTRLRRARIRSLAGRLEEAFGDLQEVLSFGAAPVETATARRALARLRTL
ncbi:tetratricopeptide repeat protein [Nonomuraea sp. NPDC050556]|uniref:tetratricopeptide repeat protein n=1 Tax=Nonomuraea sp. NPDC050556 TaxID=3364369 RepID=UPI00378A29DD